MAQSLNMCRSIDKYLQKLAFLVVLFALFGIKSTRSIACYYCVSMNGSDPACEDPMSALVPVHPYCRQTIRGHEGLFHAYYCFKIKGTRQKDGATLLIRRCSMDKLADIPTHCGQFRLDDELYTGCIATCVRDWCNSNKRISNIAVLSGLQLIIVTTFSFYVL